jgi:hypothetical protein
MENKDKAPYGPRPSYPTPRLNCLIKRQIQPQLYVLYVARVWQVGCYNLPSLPATIVVENLICAAIVGPHPFAPSVEGGY